MNYYKHGAELIVHGLDHCDEKDVKDLFKFEQCLKLVMQILRRLLRKGDSLFNPSKRSIQWKFKSYIESLDKILEKEYITITYSELNKINI